MTMGFIDTFEETQAEVSTGDGDHDKFAHFVNKEDIAETYINGTPVIALCGKIWVPSRDPEKFKVCPTCKEIHDALFLG